MPLLPPGYFIPGYFIPGYLSSEPAALIAAALSITVSVGYSPDPSTAAIEITEVGTTYGPYAATVGLDTLGNPTLTVTFTMAPGGLVPGVVSITPGDIILGVFVPHLDSNGDPVTISGVIRRPEIPLPGSQLTRQVSMTGNLLIFQGETEYYLKMPVSDDLGLLITTGVVVVVGRWSGIAAGITGTLVDTTNAAIGGGAGYLALMFPPDWADLIIPTGDYQVNALLDLSDGKQAALDTPIDLVVSRSLAGLF